MAVSGQAVAKQIPNANLFIVHLISQNKDEVSQRLKSIGSTEDLGEDNTLLLRVNKKFSKPQAGWQRLTKLIGSSGTVQPVLSDETGQPHYPTGELTVRFLKKPSNKDLKQFTSRYGLRLRDINEFVPEQIAFQVIDPTTTYLPELVRQISLDKMTKSAWANTLSQYKRMK
jgi:hypothetical protein